MGFIVLVLALLGFDLQVTNRKPHVISSRQATLWSAVWVLLAIAFCASIYLWHGSHDALDFLTAYVIEESLSLDNLAVFVVVFTSAAVDVRYQHRVLFWGILGVLVTRGVFVFAGVELISHFHWFLYVLGIFLIVAGARFLRKGRGGFDPARSRLLSLAGKLFPITSTYEGGRFFVRQEGRRFATPLLLVLLTIEITDVFFAADSVPAVLSVTQDVFIVYTSNIFAVLGLRALYPLLADAVRRFRYLRHGLAVVLMFVGTKMLLARRVRIPTGWALLVILGVIGLAVAASLLSASLGKKDRRVF
jgi:tellurite resistance protein TerC